MRNGSSIAWLLLGLVAILVLCGLVTGVLNFGTTAGANLANNLTRPQAPAQVQNAPAPLAQVPSGAPQTQLQQLSAAPAQDLVVGQTYSPFDGLTFTYSGNGTICGVQSTVWWMVPQGASVDVYGVKYFFGKPVPPSNAGTFFDCHLWKLVTMVNAAPQTQPQQQQQSQNALKVCSIADLKALSFVADARVLDAANGQALVVLEPSIKNFQVPQGWEVDYDSQPQNHYPTVLEKHAENNATFWSPEQCKPLQ